MNLPINKPKEARKAKMLKNTLELPEFTSSPIQIALLVITIATNKANTTSLWCIPSK